MAFMRDPVYILMQDGLVDIHSLQAPRTNALFTQELFDEIVIMRYYNMTEVERRAVIDRVLEWQFEIGADGVRKASGLPTTMERVILQLEESGKTLPA